MPGGSVLLTGGSGMLARALADAFRQDGRTVTALSRHELDVTDSKSVENTFDLVKPTLVIQCAAFTRVDAAEAQREYAFEVNEQGTRNIARACQAIGARLVYPGTDYVFDGAAREPYAPDAEPHPLNVYGASKLAGEIAAREAGDFVILRTSWLYGPGGRNFVRTIAERLRQNQPMRIVDDQQGAPTWTIDLAQTVIDLIRMQVAPGVYHATNSGETTWYELACEVRRLLRVDGSITPCTTSEFPAPAKRPPYSVLDCSDTMRLVGPIRDWRHALEAAITSGAY